MLEHKQKWEEAGEEYFVLQDFSAAAHLLEKGRAWQRASEAYRQSGATEEALRCDAHAAEAEKQWVVASHIWSSLGQAVKAFEAIRKTNDLLLIKPLEAEAFTVEGKYDRAAVLYEQVADWDKAIQSWEKAERWQEATKLCLKLKHYPEATQYSERLSSPNARAKFKVRIKIAQSDTMGARQIAETDMTSIEAIEFFQEAGLNTEARYFEARLAEEKGQLYKATIIWQELGNVEAAERSKKAIPQHKIFSAGSISLSELYSVLSLEEAMLFLAQGIAKYDCDSYTEENYQGAISSTDYSTKEAEAIALKREGKFDQAFALYEELFLKAPYHEVLHRSVFKTLVASGKFHEAQRALELWVVAVAPRYGCGILHRDVPKMVFRDLDGDIFKGIKLEGKHLDLKFPQENDWLSLWYLAAAWATLNQQVCAHIGRTTLINAGKISSKATNLYAKRLQGVITVDFLRVEIDDDEYLMAGYNALYSLPWHTLEQVRLVGGIWSHVLEGAYRRMSGSRINVLDV